MVDALRRGKQITKSDGQTGDHCLLDSGPRTFFDNHKTRNKKSETPLLLFSFSSLHGQANQFAAFISKAPDNITTISVTPEASSQAGTGVI